MVDAGVIGTLFALSMEAWKVLQAVGRLVFRGYHQVL